MIAEPAVPAGARSRGSVRPRATLLVRSAVLLFVELWLIRWTGAYVVYLAYFTNFVLLASFLGIGIGFLRASRPRDRSRYAPLALAAYVGFVLLFSVDVHRTNDGLVYGSPWFVLPQVVLLPILFVGVAVVMALMGEGVARTFARFEPLEGYLLDLVGGLCGVAAFAALAYLQTPPAAAAAIAGAILMLGPRRELAVRLIGVAATLVLLVVAGVRSSDLWSPYYRITMSNGVSGDPSVSIAANGVPHQTMKSVASLRKHNSIYLLPYTHLATPPPSRVLVIGAGTGNDTAVALSEGARRVDAVEIDPRLLRIGQDRHPDRPFDDPRVHPYVTDGRQFLERSRGRYDLILFALPDSLTLVSGQSSLRLENYLFTIEAVRAARRHLAPGGAFAMYNYYRRPWLIDRLAVTMGDAFGRAPCVDVIHAPRAPTVLIEGESADAIRCATRWRPATSPTPAPSTDDHPFPYLRTPSIPRAYLGALALLLAASFVAVSRTAGGLGAVRGYLDLFFMGAAFLLLETKSVVQFALLFGTTWVVNALVFSGVFIALILAVLTARRTRAVRPGPAYAGLLAMLAVAWIVPVHALLSLPFISRFVVAVALAFGPVYLANLVFSERFATVGVSTAAFAANLLGAMVGGGIEYVSLALGYRSLLLVAAGLYLIAWILRPGTAFAWVARPSLTKA